MANHLDDRVSKDAWIVDDRRLSASGLSMAAIGLQSVVFAFADFQNSELVPT